MNGRGTAQSSGAPPRERTGSGKSSGALPRTPPGEIISPGPPCFRRRLRPRRGGSVQAMRVAEAMSDRGRLRMPECLAGAVRSADAVQVCASAPTCGGRLLSGLRRTLVSKDGFPDVLEGTPRASSHMQTGRSSLNALGPATCLQAVAPTGISRRDSLPALSAAAVVQAAHSVQCVSWRRDRADAEAPERKRAERSFPPHTQNSLLFRGALPSCSRHPPCAATATPSQLPFSARTPGASSQQLFTACFPDAPPFPDQTFPASNSVPLLPKMSPRTAIFVDNRENF